MKKVICSFADTKYKESLDRLEKQIKNTSFFDEYYLLDQTNLDDSFLIKFKDVLSERTRGYGYWVWKPYIIKRILDQLDDGDILVYVDAGCHIHNSNRKRLNKYFELVDNSKNGIVAFQKPIDQLGYGLLSETIIRKNFFIECNWTKGDLFDYFDSRHITKVVDTPQIIGTVILLQKRVESLRIIDQWMNVFEENFDVVNDSISRSPNLSGFVENRHDQSVFSILCKLNDVDLLSTDEIEAEPAIVMNNPIIAIRDIGGRMAYKSFGLLRITRILKSPFLYVLKIMNRNPRLLNR